MNQGSMYDVMRAAALESPETYAYRFMGGGARKSAFLQEVDAAAAALQEMGLRPGDSAAVCLPNIPQAPVAFYALQKLGVAANMIHPLTPPASIAAQADFTGAKLVFLCDLFYGACKGHFKNIPIVLCSAAQYLSPLKRGVFLFQNRKKLAFAKTGYTPWPVLLKKGRQKQAAPANHPQGTAVYLHSGGTTGMPKTIALSAGALNSLAAAGPHMAGVKDVRGKMMLAVLPLFHGFGLGVCVHTMLANGGGFVLVPRYTAKGAARLMVKEKVAMVAAVPSMLESLLAAGVLAGKDLSGLQAVFCGGDSLSLSLKERFDKVLLQAGSPSQVMEGYGLTETVTVCTVNTPAENRPGSVGKPIPRARVCAASVETGAFLPAGEKGELCVHAPTMMQGYWQDEAATKAAVRYHGEEPWVHTGDYGYVDEEGYVWFCQRLKRIIKCSGVAVFPSEIEEVVSAVPGVFKAYALGKAHPQKGETVALFVVAAPGNGEEELKEAILAACRARLIRWAVPASIYFLPEMPVTPIGKTDGIALQKLLDGLG